jgi:hypothetical protein
MAVTQRDLANINDMENDIDLLIQVGNAGIGSSRVKVNGRFIKDANGDDRIFNDTFTLDLGQGKKVKRVEVETKITPNPAIADKSMILSYDLTNVTFFTGKSRTLKVPASAGLPSETFFVTVTLF